jgi:hypothetical protein
MKRLTAIILIVVVLLILGATPVVAAIGPPENGNFGGNNEPQHPWVYYLGTWHLLGDRTHEINWSTAVFIIPTEQAGHASFESPTHGNIGIDSTPFYLPVP